VLIVFWGASGREDDGRAWSLAPRANPSRESRGRLLMAGGTHSSLSRDALVGSFVRRDGPGQAEAWRWAPRVRGDDKGS
jgi:hypothetical protein